MEEILEMLQNRKAIQMGHIAEDKGRYNDPFLGQFMRGRVAVEENDVDWLDDIIERVEAL
jgi:hypothetical protein